MDFRNAIKWYQYDPTKWFISLMSKFGLASHLKKFPDNEIRKGQYTMKLQQLQEQGDKLNWPKSSNDLPVISWDDFQAEAKERSLIAIHGFIHDASSFAEDHPGGAHLIKRAIGTDATTAFFGGVYDHSNAAHNLLAMMRVGILDGGMEVEALKRRHADSISSAASTPSLSSASSSSDDLQSLLSDTDSIRQRKTAVPTGQPAAAVASKWTLSVPPSETLRIVQTTPDIRPGIIGRRPSLGSLDGETRADKNDEVSPMLGGA